MASWDSAYGQLEQQANDFAATLLMPLDDFRSQIDVYQQPDFKVLGKCAERYDVSLIASTLRWLQYTSRRAVLVISREGFILWARSSKSALKSKLFIRTRGLSPIEVPGRSLAARRAFIAHHTHFEKHSEGIWFAEPCSEHVLFSDQYHFTISLLHFANAETQAVADEDYSNTHTRA